MQNPPPPGKPLPPLKDKRLPFLWFKEDQWLNEKASVLRNLEAGKMAPNNQLASKLEHMLKIKLLVPISEEKTPLPRSASQELTLGDVIEIDKGEEAASKRKPS
jgi:hypothetical protein